LALAAIAGLPKPATAMEGDFDIGLVYVNGFTKASDAVKNYYQENDYSVSRRWNVPVGLQLSGSLQWDVNDTLSLGPELRLGPMMYMETTTIGGSLGSGTIFMFPVTGSARCTFLPKAKVSPFLRAGVSYIAATGDLVGDSRVGFEGAVGLEFFRNRLGGFGLEGGYNTAQVNIAGQDVKPVGFFGGIYGFYRFGAR
jgi:hypothetical protein